MVAAALRRGRAGGEVSTAAAPQVQAHLLLLHFQSSALASRAGTDRDQIVRSIGALRQLGAPAAAGRRPAPPRRSA
jgi:hypothetical protein